MKKIITMLLAGMMVLSLSVCTKNENVSSADEVTEETVGSYTLAKSPVVTVRN